jgi:hypothetical protein
MASWGDSLTTCIASLLVQQVVRRKGAGRLVRRCVVMVWKQAPFIKKKDDRTALTKRGCKTYS